MNDNYKYEIDRWLRTLSYIQQENISMKNRLAELTHSKINKHLLKDAEYYQTAFLNKDIIIAFLRQDIFEFQNDGFSEGKKIERKTVLETDMRKMEQEFSKLKFDFNDFVSDYMTN